MTVSQIHDPATAAIEAAHIALELSAHAHYSQRMVFRVFNFTDIRAAIDAAQVARQQRNQPVTHHTVYVEARNSIHELVIDSDQISWPIGDGITTVVVTTTSTYPIELSAFTYSLERPIVSAVHEAAEIHGVYVHEIIHVIDDEPAGTS